MCYHGSPNLQSNKVLGDHEEKPIQIETVIPISHFSVLHPMLQDIQVPYIWFQRCGDWTKAILGLNFSNFPLIHRC